MFSFPRQTYKAKADEITSNSMHTHKKKHHTLTDVEGLNEPDEIDLAVSFCGSSNEASDERAAGEPIGLFILEPIQELFKEEHGDFTLDARFFKLFATKFNFFSRTVLGTFLAMVGVGVVQVGEDLLATCIESLGFSSTADVHRLADEVRTSRDDPLAG